MRTYGRLVWLLPAVAVAAWLESFFGAPIVGQAISALYVQLSWKSFSTNLLG